MSASHQILVIDDASLDQNAIDDMMKQFNLDN